MRSFILLGAAALVASSPAPAGIAFAAVQSAPLPLSTGPAVGVPFQNDVYDREAGSREAIAAPAPGASGEEKRKMHKRSKCSGHPHKPHKPHTGKPAPPHHGHSSAPHGGHSHYPGGGQPSHTTTRTTSRYGTYTTIAPPTPTSPGSSITVSRPPVTTTSQPPHEVPSSCTPVSWTNTFAFTTNSACSTPYEVGTYCGFINPEDPCAIQPDGFGPVSSPDTVDAFLANEALHKMATSAPTPKGYQSTFTDLNAAVNANSYLGYSTLKSYDVQHCADLCDKEVHCNAFNIYIERDPKWNPEQCSCKDPDSITNFKCSLWGSGVEPAAAVNVGQSRGDFEVVITGSNGYARTE